MKSTNSVRDILNTPKNDDELNIVINSINRANGKYFNTAVSDKRFEKLRDSVCEGIGFVNGGYQQLKAHWATVNAYNIEEHGLFSGLFCGKSNASIASVASPFANVLLAILCEHYPQNKDGLISGDDISVYFDPHNYNAEDFGWRLTTLPSTAIGKYELKYGNITVGYTFYETDAVFLNAILLDLMMNKLAHSAFNIDKPNEREAKWLAFVASCGGLSKAEPEKYLHLRKSSMDYGLAFHFDEINVCSTDIRWSHNSIVHHIYADTNGNVSLGGTEFDFINVYSSKGVSLAYEDVTVSDITAIEWFAHEKLEWCTLDDEDAISELGFAGDDHACTIK